MYNPITFVKDIIDLLKQPPGEAVAACEITPNNRAEIIAGLGPRSEKYAKTGDFVVEFENTVSIAPAKEFHKHYAFDGPILDEMNLTPVRTIKAL